MQSDQTESATPAGLAGNTDRLRYLALSTLVPCMVWETDPEGLFRMVSDHVLEFLRRHPAELIGQPFSSLFEDQSWSIRAHVGVPMPGNADMEPHPAIHVARDRDGTLLFCRVESRRIRDTRTVEDLGFVGVAHFGDQANVRAEAETALARVLSDGLLGAALIDGAGTVRYANMALMRTLLGESSGASSDPAVLPDTLFQVFPAFSGKPEALDWISASGSCAGDPTLQGFAGPFLEEADRRLVLTIDNRVHGVIAEVKPEGTSTVAIIRAYARHLFQGFGHHGRRIVSTLESSKDAGPRESLSLLPAEPEKNTDFSNLTARQLQVLRLLAEGKTNKEIGRAIGVTEATVKAHVRSMKNVLGVRTRTAIAIQAARLPTR